MSTDAIELRIAMVDGRFDLTDETVEFMNKVRSELAATLRSLATQRPPEYDYGRFVAFCDAVQAAKNVACDSAILGNELATRKRAKTADTE